MNNKTLLDSPLVWKIIQIDESVYVISVLNHNNFSIVMPICKSHSNVTLHGHCYSTSNDIKFFIQVNSSYK